MKTIFKFLIITLFILIGSYFVQGVSTYGAATEFGNETNTTCWIGGDTGNLTCLGDVVANSFIGITTTYLTSTQINASYALNVTLDQYVDWISGNNTYARLATFNNFSDVNHFGRNVSFANNITVGDDIYIGDADEDHYIYFYGTGGPTEESIRWSQSSGNFIFSDSAQFLGTDEMIVGGVQSSGDIHTTGIGDDLWLGGVGVQENALFRAYADGSLFSRNFNARGDGNFSGSIIIGNDTEMNNSEWIRPEHIVDIDDEDIESDLNTYVDIAGDVMSGDLVMTSNITLATDYNISSGSGWMSHNGSCWFLKGTDITMVVC